MRPPGTLGVIGPNRSSAPHPGTRLPDITWRVTSRGCVAGVAHADEVPLVCTLKDCDAELQSLRSRQTAYWNFVAACSLALLTNVPDCFHVHSEKCQTDLQDNVGSLKQRHAFTMVALVALVSATSPFLIQRTMSGRHLDRQELEADKWQCLLFKGTLSISAIPNTR